MTCLGIDTSCYRTSVACADDAGYVQRRKLLRVPLGKRGLMQSEMVFQHVGNLPMLMDELMAEVKRPIDSVCATSRPRPMEGSYMPAFTVGDSFGRSLAAALGVPYCETSHQQCHLGAALIGNSIEGPFLALHLSGGTTELLLSDESLGVRLLGGTGDLPVGQLIDRVGVALGFEFPAGPALEHLAMGASPQAAMPTSIKGLMASFSGAEAQAMRMIEAGEGRERVAAEVFSLVARSLSKLIAAASGQTGCAQALLFGGVASSGLLKTMLAERLQRLKCSTKVYWADPQLSGDNAVGAARIGLMKHRGDGK